ncbi:MAG TPA: YheU family protein [Steroidobacteraceae bacterium]|nr:YheU family protein [Steroidobacteraceae bacterium]
MALHRDPAPAEQGAPRLTDPADDPIAILPAQLSAEALRGVIESFVLREGTDYGEREFSLEQKVAQVRAQLERGQARILFDPQSSTVTIEIVPALPPRSRA